MPLQTQPIDIIFNGGLDTKSQEALVSSGSLLKAENATRLKTGEFRKRKGFKTIGDRTFATPNVVLSYRDELISVASNKLRSYDSGNNGWVDKDDLVIATTDINTVFSNPSQNQDRAAATVVGRLTLFTWVDSTLIRYSIKDNTTQTDLVVNQSTGLTCASGEAYRVEALGNNFYIVAGGSGNNLDTFKIQSAAGFKTSTSTVLTDFDNTNKVFDTVVVGNNLYISYRESTGGNIRTATLNTSLAITNVQDITDTPTNLGVYAYTGDSGVRYAIAWVDGFDEVKAAIYNENLLIIQPTTSLDTAQNNVNKLVIHENPTNPDEVTVYWNRYDSSTPSNTLIRQNTLDSSTAGTASDFLRSVDIYSKAVVYAGRAYILVKHESTLQSTFFLAQTSTGNIVAKAAQATAAPIDTSRFTSPIRALSDTMFSVALDVQGRLQSGDNTLFTLSEISSVDFEFDLNDAYNNVEAGGLLYIAGGVLHHYDGRFVTESGFHLFPETISKASSTATGGALDDGTRQYVAVYTWYDNVGNRHQSAPSAAISVTLAAGTSTQISTITVPTLRLTRKQGSRGVVQLDLYRTEDAGSIFYKITSLANIVVNDTTVDSVDILDSTSDADLISNEILYTEGGVLDNIAPPPCKRLEVYDDRLFLAGLPNDTTVQYSKVIKDGDGPAFNEALFTKVPGKAEEVTALKTLDNNLLIFRDDLIHVLSGQGPTDTGVDDGFTRPELLASDTGAVDSRSVVLGSSGVYFKSRKGLYLVTRNLEVQYIGSPAEQFNSNMVTSAVLTADTNEIRFTTDDSTVIAHNYYFGDWTTYEGLSIKSSTIWNNSHVVMYTDGRVAQEYAGYRDAGAFYNMKLQTGWLKLSNIAGFQRIKRMVLYGTYQSDHQLNIKVFTDYSDTVRQTVTFKPTDVLSRQVKLGDVSPFGAETPFGGRKDNDLYMFEVHIKSQKCHSIRFEISDEINPGVDPQNDGEAVRLVGFTLLAGVKTGVAKNRTGRKT